MVGIADATSKRVETARVSTYPGEVIALDDPASGPPFMVGTADATSKRVETARVSTYPGEVIALDDPASGPPFMVGTTDATSDLLGHDNHNDRIESIMIKASFVGANPDPNMVGLEEMEYKCNYFIGNDPNEWHTDVPNYEYVLYKNIYPGIDLKYYGNGKKMEYDFIISPGADPSQIRIRYEGAKSLSVNETGELEVKTAWNTVTEQAPFIYQETLDGRREVVGKYRLLENNTFGFALEKEYDSSLPLIIDPTLIYSTYLGAGNGDYGYGIAVDGSGNAYVTGKTSSFDFPTVNPYQMNHGWGSYDVFVTKLSSSGDSLIYSTYLGGGDEDWGWGIAVDGSGNTYVTGYTSSSNFPTENPYQMNQGGRDVFVTKFSSSGSSLIYSTYLGRGGDDRGFGIAVDVSGNAYVMGYTNSSDFPTENPYQATYQGFADVFVTKFYAEPSYICGDADGNQIVEVSDAVFLVRYIFVPGSRAPIAYEAGDVDCNGVVDIVDAVYIINYVFVPGSPEPCDPDGDGEPDC